MRSESENRNQAWGIGLLLGALGVCAGGALAVSASEPSAGEHGGEEGAREPSTPRSPARRAFERFQSLAGVWHGESSMGWKDEVVFENIARDSVVMQTSQFEAHPGETMVTMFHLHEDRLLLTHYCVAGNQPRLYAARFENDGLLVSFEYLDATGLGHRDQGHMDAVVYRFDADGDGYSAEWSWYENGVSEPMERIRLERVPEPR